MGDGPTGAKQKNGKYPSTIAAKNNTKKIVFNKNCFGTINFVKITINLFTKQIRMFSCKQGQTTGSNIAKKMFWWN